MFHSSTKQLEDSNPFKANDTLRIALKLKFPQYAASERTRSHEKYSCSALFSHIFGMAIAKKKDMFFIRTKVRAVNIIFACLH